MADKNVLPKLAFTFIEDVRRTFEQTYSRHDIESAQLHELGHKPAGHQCGDDCAQSSQLHRGSGSALRVAESPPLLRHRQHMRLVCLWVRG